LIEHTIGEALAIAADRWGERDALVSVAQGIRWSFAELLERADALAAGLLALGLEPGDRIGIWAPNCAEWTLTQFAAARAGLILVTINPAYRLSEVEFTINQGRPAALGRAAAFKTSDYLGMIEQLAPSCRWRARAMQRRGCRALRSSIQIGGDAASGLARLRRDVAGRSARPHDRIARADRPDA
jgi:fatty-acyl-CoA synthase